MWSPRSPRPRGAPGGKGYGGGGGKGAGRRSAVGSCASPVGGMASPRGGAPTEIFAYDPVLGTTAAAPDLAAPESLCGGSAARSHAALLSERGAVLCGGANDCGQLGVGSRLSVAGLSPARLPWPAAAVRCGVDFSVAVRRGGGALCSWGAGREGQLGRGGDGSIPGEVQGLPHGSRIALLGLGRNFAIAVTRDGDAYGWGCNWDDALALGDGVLQQSTPQRIAALSGRGLRRLACGLRFAVAEARGGDLLAWGLRPCSGAAQEPEALQPRAGRLAFPLRSLAAGSAAGAADAAGRLWCLWPGESGLTGAGLPPAEIVVRVAAASPGDLACVAALTAEGRLWDCRKGVPSRSIAADQPRVMLPCGGCSAERIVLIPDASCGLRRCRLLLLAAGRRGLIPGGQMRRAALIPFLVGEDWIFEESSDGESASEESSVR